jgi:hypothetical protein
MRRQPFGTDPFVVRDVDLRRWRAGFPEAVAIADLQRRRPATCVGVVERIRLVPHKALEVMIADGSGRLVGSWSGRTRLPGVELGGGLRLTGTVSVGADDLPRMLNPAWELVAEPYT